MTRRLIQLRGLLLINSNGDKYFIEAGIKPYKEPELIGSLDGDPEVTPDTNPHIRLLPIRPISNDQIEQFESEKREEWFLDSEETEADSPNLGPFVFQAFNVIVRVPDVHDEGAITGAAGDVSAQ